MRFAKLNGKRVRVAAINLATARQGKMQIFNILSRSGKLVDFFQKFFDFQNKLIFEGELELGAVTFGLWIQVPN